MPIYEYKCTKCAKEFELFQNITDPAAKRCKFCKGPVNKLISMSSFHLKGSGWYVTDYNKSGSAWKDKAPEKKDEIPKVEAAPKKEEKKD